MTVTAAQAAPEASPTVDPWALATGSTYDPDTIYTRASDDKGHSTIIHAKVSTTLGGEIRALVESREIPELRTHADIVRDALIHRCIHYRAILKAKGKATGTLTSAINTEIREAELDAIARKHTHWTNLIDKLDARVAECISIGDYDTAWHLIDRNGDTEDMSAPFVARLEAVLERHTQHLRRVSPRLPIIEDTPYRDDVVPMRRRLRGRSRGRADHSADRSR